MRSISGRKEGKWKRAGIFLVLLAVLLVLGNSVHKVYNKKVEAQKTLARMEEEVKNLKDREKFLKDSIERLDTKEGMAFEMRKKLNVAEAGESVAIIVEEGESVSAPTPQPSFWQKAKDFFVGLFK